MFEAIVTLVSTETTEGVTYPVTKVFRLEFDTLEDMQYFEMTLQNVGGTTNVEKLVAEGYVA